MSYLYDVLRDALGGSSFSGKTSVSQKWSPNEIRAIVIMRDFLLVADYLKFPQVVVFDREKLNKDLSNPSRRGNLNNLLEDRQLSCLEEFYIDGAFKDSFKGVINLEEYVQGLFNTQSRLRYYGYVTGMNVSALTAFYKDAIQYSKKDYTLAKDMGGFGYIETNNVDWYKKFNLRPNYYDLDKPNGRLNAYFTACQRSMEVIAKEYEAKTKALSESNKIIKMLSFDVNLVYRVQQLMSFSNFLKTMKMPMISNFGKELNDELKVKRVFKGLTTKGLLSTLKEGGYPDTSEAKQTLELYSQLWIFDNNEGEIKDGGEGFLQLGTRLSNALCATLKSVRSAEDKAVWRIVLYEIKGMPEGELRKELKSKLDIYVPAVEMSNTVVDMLIGLAYEIGCFTEEGYKKKMIKEKGGNG